jgi:hypothetical protein
MLRGLDTRRIFEPNRRSTAAGSHAAGWSCLCVDRFAVADIDDWIAAVMECGNGVGVLV